MADTSETPEVQETEHVTAPQAGDLGQQLKRCREKAGLDIEQAASEMRLSPHLLRALEEEDFQTLPEPPYVRGYLRSYARLSDHNPNQLIRIYEGLRGGDGDFTTQFTPLTSIDRMTKPGMSSFTAKLLGLLLLIAVLGGISMMPDVRHWVSNLWSSFSEKVEDTTQSTEQSSESDTATTTGSESTGTRDTAQENTRATTSTSSISIPKIKPEETETSADTAPDADNLSGDIQRDGSDDGDTSNAADAADADTANANAPADSTSVDTESTEDNNNSGTDNATNSANASEEETPTASTEGDTDSAETTATDGTGTEDKPEVTDADTAEADDSADGVDTTKQPIDGDVTIRMEFEQEVWLQIRDTEDKPIFETLKSSGHQQELKAHTPLKFKVGNAAGVKIYLNGVLFDQKPHTRGNVANFEVK